jgi:hypothetical protein
LLQAAGLARIGAARLLARAGGPSPDPDAISAGLTAAISEQTACWLARSRPGGLEDSLVDLRATLATSSGPA